MKVLSPRCALLLGGALWVSLVSINADPAMAQEVPLAKDQVRSVEGDAQLRAWLENMVWHHRFSTDEIAAVTGLDHEAIGDKLSQFEISAETKPGRDEKLLVLPYPGGRHPRIGFLDGAIAPQRETKLSVFAPWDDRSYAVIDVPEAIWSNLGLTYLAHTHIETVWTRKQIALEQLEWKKENGSFKLQRSLPNGIRFGVRVTPKSDHVEMQMWLHNGTKQPLSDLRVQNCVMLRGMEGFTQQDNENKVFQAGYAAAHSTTGNRWVITAWDPLHRTWANTGCPCLHADPKFDDCAPGETKWLRGWFSFFEGDDIATELSRIEDTGWRDVPLDLAAGNLTGVIVENGSEKALPGRLYIESLDRHDAYFARSSSGDGSAIIYDKQRAGGLSSERHTTLSAGNFEAFLPPGRYRIIAGHGKEFLPAERIVEVGQDPVHVELALQRLVDMSARGWYSGDTHVHRSMEELPNLVLAEDLNVALPLNYWVRDSRESPADSGPAREPAPLYVDAQHVIYPVNTEYEIFSVDGKRHTQGAVFVLNHRRPLIESAPPVKAIAQEARRQGAILDLDKHSWNWSMMVVPLMNVDLFELSNNHHWRTQFGFPQWTLENAPQDWPEIEIYEEGFTESGWTHFGLQTYYALLNCGFRMRVSAGTASGVHPVPLGYGRVYVHVDGDFRYEKWIQNLNAGKSFVTQGPLMDLRFNGQLPGAQLAAEEGSTINETSPPQEVKITGEIYSRRPLAQIDIVRNGQIAGTTLPQGRSVAGGYIYDVDLKTSVEGSGWVACRCFEEPLEPESNKLVFAHTNPVFIDKADRPLRPRRRDVEFFVERMEAEIARNQGVVSEAALEEFKEAKKIYETILETAVD